MIKSVIAGCIIVVCLTSTFGDPLVVSSFEVLPQNHTVSVVASNTLDVTRYALQMKSDLGGTWSNKQNRLARDDSQLFEAQLPPHHNQMFFRVLEHPFSTDLLTTGTTTKVFSLATTYSPGPFAHWMTCNQVFIEPGTGVLSSIQASGIVSYPPTITNSYLIGGDGSISDTMGTDVGLMNLDNDLSVSVDAGTNFSGWTQMFISLQSGGSDFSTEDLEGFWEMYTLTVADNAGDYMSWSVSDYTFNASGNGTATSTLRSDGSTNLSPSVTFAVNTDGTISSGLPESTWFMSMDKNMITTVMNDGGGGITLGIMLRDEGSGCKTSDIAGRWQAITLVAADDPGDWTGWQSAILDISTNGYVTVELMQRSDGSSPPVPPFSVWVAEEGTVNGLVWEDALLSLDKNLIVGVGNHEQGGLSLGMMLRN